MDQPWITDDRGIFTGPDQHAQPMSQEEALNILKSVAAKYAPAQPVTPQLDDWVAGCTEDFGD